MLIKVLKLPMFHIFDENVKCLGYSFKRFTQKKKQYPYFVQF